MVEPIELEQKLIEIVATNGLVKLCDLQNTKTVKGLLRKGIFYNPSLETVAIAELPAKPDEPKKEIFVFNPESIDWGNPITPKTAKAQAKGDYFLTKDTKNPAYKFLSGSLSEALVKGEHKITFAGYDYWLNFGGGLARRKVTQK